VRILVEQHHGIGDVVHMLPMLEQLRKTYYYATIDLLVGSSTTEYIAGISGLVDNIYRLPKGRLKEIVLAIQLRKYNYDIGILSVITNEKMGQIFLWLSGCRKLIFETSAPPFFPQTSLTATRNSNMHRVVRNIRLGGLAGADTVFLRPELKMNCKKTKKNCKRIVGIVIDVNKTRGVFAKLIPLDKQKEIIKSLLNENKIEIWLFGNPHELNCDFTDEIKKYPGRIHNFIGKTTIKELLDLLQQCDIVVGGDTGPIHVADALNIATLTIFGPTSPSQFRPLGSKAMIYSLGVSCQYCYGTTRIISCKYRKCLRDIDVKQIVEKIIKMLSRK